MPCTNRKLFKTKLNLMLACVVFFCAVLTNLAQALANTTNSRTDLPRLNAAAAILIDADTGSVIHQHHAHQTNYPASLTKIMTALLLIEHVPDLDNTRIYHSVDAVFSIPRRTSNIAMNDGETLSARHALYAIMLASANEVSNAIAEHIAGDMDSFAQLMTQRAHELGAVNTQFYNAHGLHHEGHQTTAYDLSLIMLEAMRHPVFLEIINTRVFSIPPTERQPLDRTFTNSHRMIRPHEPEFNPQVIGGKTGFHNQARHGLVTYARQDGVGLVAVVMGNDSGHQFTDTQALLNFGFALYETMPIINASNFDFDQTIRVVQAESPGARPVQVGQVRIAPENNLLLSLPATFQTDSVELVINVDNQLTAPVEAGQVVGRVSAVYRNRELGWVNLVTTASFEPLADISHTLHTQTGELLLSQDTAPAQSTAVALFTHVLALTPTDWVTTVLLVVSVCALLLIVRMSLRSRHRRKKRHSALSYRGGHVLGLNHNNPMRTRGPKNGRHPTRYRYK